MQKVAAQHKEHKSQKLFDLAKGILRVKHNFYETVLQKAAKTAMRKAVITKHTACHAPQHSGVYPPSFCGATHVLQNGYDIRTVQELPGHSDVRTTMTYTHVIQHGGQAVRSPTDMI